MWGLGIEPAPSKGALNYRAISPASRYQFLLVFPQKILMETLEHNITKLASTRENWVLRAKCDLGSVDSSHCRLTHLCPTGNESVECKDTRYTNTDFSMVNDVFGQWS